MNGLSNKEKKQFSQIIYTLSQRQRNQQINSMNQQQRKTLKTIIAQKIINDAAKKQILPPKGNKQDFSLAPSSPGFLSTALCCFKPQDNRHHFDITSQIFIRRFLGVFLIYKQNFLKFGIPKIRNGQRLKDDQNDRAGIFQNYNEQEVDSDGRNNTPDLYGPLWLTITYLILIGICANLNDYFWSGQSQNYLINVTYFQKAFGILLIFMVGQSLLYKAIVQCLKGTMKMSQSFCLVGYAQVLYFISTAICIIPSFYVHIIALTIGGLMKMVFLYRNFGKFVESKKLTLLLVFGIVQFLYFLCMLKIIFLHHKGYSVSSGTNVVFNHRLRFYQDHQIQI